MIDVLAIDRWSSANRGWLHRVPPPVKVALVGVCIAVLVATRDVGILAAVYAILLAALFTSRLPVRPILALSALPLTMSAIFALTRLGGSWESAIAIVEKGAITSLVLLLLMASTPATDLFRILRRVMPRTLAEMLFLGYRSIFILLARALAAREALRLRSGRLSPAARLRRNALVGALSVLRASELAADQYAAMRLRGFGA
jgi:energy-coupling factor transporter transmembrane protein EcfT